MFYVTGVHGGVEKDYRLTPAMSSRKLQVVSFVQQYIARWGSWPSYGEIAGAMGIERSTARDAVRRAVRDGLLDRVPGSRKSAVPGLTARPRLLPSDAAEILEQLRAAGVVILQHGADQATPTFRPLPRVPPFEQIPSAD